MSNSNTAVRDNRELTLFLGTYWFDFEQAAELGNEVLAKQNDIQRDDQETTAEEQAHNYVI